MTPPPSSYWRTGDDPGGRAFATVRDPSGGPFRLESGATLDTVTVAYETWGSPSRSADNAVLVLHALTGDSHASGDAGPGHVTPGWWRGIIGPGLAIDTDRFYVVCPNVLGACQGTTGPSSLGVDGKPFGSRFPVITIRDQVAVEVALADHLGIERWAGIVGGSMGGMRVLEWALLQPARVQRAVVLCVGAAATADQIALSSLQVRAIQVDPHFAGGHYYDHETGPFEGLAIARGLGQFSYRTGLEFESRFGRALQLPDQSVGAQYAIQSYLGYQGAKLVKRFDPNSYIVLSEAMNHHDVGRGRGGVAAALSGVDVAVSVAGIRSDRLYPLELQEELVGLLPHADPLTVMTSPFGHDGFLLEVEQVGKVIDAALNK